ncbi:13067_t:CDS:2, partial [Dentiscutata heterogama]
GKHCAVFMFTFLAIDFVLDILFVIVHGQDLYWLYPASVIFITIPIIVNSGFTFLLISREISKNKKFSNWWFRSSKTALLFTILAGADIDVLNILSSECGRLEELSAPFSVIAMKRIRLFNIISIIIEDLPQLIILIRAESPDIPSKPESPNSGKESDTSPTHSEVRHEYLTMKDDGVPTISYPRDDMQIHDIPYGHVGESIINIEEGTSGEIGETLKKAQSIPKRKSDSGIIESTGEPGQSTYSTTGAPTYQSKMMEQLDPSSEQVTSPPKSTSSKAKELFSFIGGGKSKKGTTAPKEEADKGKSSESEEGGKVDNDDDNV